MPDPFLGEIRMFGGTFAPQGWHFCDGSLLPISQYDALYSLIGTTYGGDGNTTFALPDLRSRVPVHAGTLAGQPFTLGDIAGAETVVLTPNQLPQHTHLAQANSAQGTKNTPAGNVWAANATLTQYSNGAPSVNMDPAASGMAGGSQPHDNMAPFLVVNFILALSGTYPSQG